MRRIVAVLLGVLVAAVAAQGAFASDDGKTTLGPAGYSGPGAKRTLIVAGTANAVLGSDDHVVICHAIGGPKGTDFIQIAPSASGVVSGHGKHQDDRDVIPPFSFSDKKGTDSSLAAGQNWNSASATMYANGCRAPATTRPTDVCPNIEGVQTAVPSGMTKDSAGNCVTTVALAPPPTTTTLVVEKMVVNTMVVKTVKVVTKKAKAKAKKKVKKVKVKVKAKKKAKKAKIRVKGVQKKFTPRVLPHTR